MTDVFGTQTPEPVDPIEYAKTKFKNDQGEIDLAKLAAAKLEADRFIERIQQENEELRGEVKTRIGLEEFLTKVNTPPKNEIVPPVQGNQPPNPEPTPVDIEQLVQKHLSNAEAQRIKNENQKRVNDTLARVWGNDASKNFAQAAQTLGMTGDELKALAERSPEAFFRVAGVNTQPNAPSTGPVPTSTVHISNDGSGERDMKYYQNLKKTNPTLYYSPKTQLQMHQDGTRMGERFFN